MLPLTINTPSPKPAEAIPTGCLPKVAKAAADPVAARAEAMLRMMELGMALHEIEEQLDWLDARACQHATS